MKKSISILLALVMALSLFACSAPAATDKPERAAASGEDVTLKLWVTGPGNTPHKAIAEFEEANPGVKVEVQELEWDSYTEKILMSVAAGNAPDVVTYHATMFCPWADKGLFLPIDDYVDKTEWSDVGLDMGTWNDQLLALSWGVNYRALYSRTDKLAAAGFDHAPETWDELITMAQAVTERDANGSITCIGFDVPTVEHYEIAANWYDFFYTAGGKFFNDDQTEVLFNGAEGVEAAKLLGDFINVYKTTLPGAIDDHPIDMMNNRIAMVISNYADKSLMDEAPELFEDVEITLPPYKKVKGVEVGGHMVSALAATKNPDLASKLAVACAGTVTGAVEHAELENSIPSYLPARETEYYQTNKSLQMTKGFDEYAFVIPKHPAWAQFEDILSNALTDIWLNGADAQTALDAAAAECNALLG